MDSVNIPEEKDTKTETVSDEEVLSISNKIIERNSDVYKELAQ